MGKDIKVFGFEPSSRILEGASFTRGMDVSDNQIEALVKRNMQILVESNKCKVTPAIVAYTKNKFNIDLSVIECDGSGSMHLPSAKFPAAVLRATEKGDPLAQELAALILRKHEIARLLLAKYGEETEVVAVVDRANEITEEILEKAVEEI
jgi:hypothetical protein